MPPSQQIRTQSLAKAPHPPQQKVNRARKKFCPPTAQAMGVTAQRAQVIHRMMKHLSPPTIHKAMQIARDVNSSWKTRAGTPLACTTQSNLMSALSTALRHMTGLKLTDHPPFQGLTRSIAKAKALHIRKQAPAATLNDIERLFKRSHPTRLKQTGHLGLCSRSPTRRHPSPARSRSHLAREPQRPSTSLPGSEGFGTRLSHSLPICEVRRAALDPSRTASTGDGLPLHVDQQAASCPSSEEQSISPHGTLAPQGVCDASCEPRSVHVGDSSST